MALMRLQSAFRGVTAVIAMAGLASSSASLGMAHAQGVTTGKPVRIIVGFAAGGASVECQQ